MPIHTRSQFLVCGEYTLDVRLLSYSNDGRCAQCREDEDIGCCDDYESSSCGTPGRSSSQCETYFQYCIVPTSTNTPLSFNRNSRPISCDYIETPFSTINGAPINFLQDTVLGLSNPLILSGTSSAWMVTTMYFYAQVILVANFKNRCGLFTLIDVRLCTPG